MYLRASSLIQCATHRQKMSPLTFSTHTYLVVFLNGGNCHQIIFFTLADKPEPPSSSLYYMTSQINGKTQVKEVILFCWCWDGKVKRLCAMRHFRSLVRDHYFRHDTRWKIKPQEVMRSDPHKPAWQVCVIWWTSTRLFDFPYWKQNQKRPHFQLLAP